MFLTRISIAQPVFATMVMIAISVFGLAAWRVLPIDRFPPVDFPIVAVMTPWSGASPSAVESEISVPIEDALGTLAGIDEVSSTSSQGHSTVVLRFTLDTDSGQAAEDVRDRLSSVLPDLPADADPPQVVRFNPLDDPVLSLALSSPSQPADALTRLAEDVILPAITAVKGVGSAALVGGADRHVELRLDPDRLQEHGLGVAEVIAAVRAGNALSQAGSLVEGATTRLVQLNAEARTIRELEALVIARPGGAPVYLRDVATVVESTADPESLAFHGGSAALAVDVTRVEGANVVAVADGVEKVISELASVGRIGDAQIKVITNSATEIEATYATLLSTLTEGMALAVAIVFLFLNSWRSTVITALILPISFLGTLAVMVLLGFSLNMLSMLALTLSVGILIDDAIVVRENITRHLHMGRDHARAAAEGTQEIGMAVVATTLALCAVFLPLAFMDGIVGRLFMQFGVTVAVAVLISLFISFTLDPMLSSVWHDPDSRLGAHQGWFGSCIARFDHAFDVLARIYERLLLWSLTWRKTTMALAFATFAGSLALIPRIGVEFLPATDESRITVTLETATGSSKDYTALKAQQIIALLEALPEVAGTYTTVAAGNDGADNEAAITVTLVDPADRAASAEEMTSRLRYLQQQVPGIVATVSASGGFGPDDAPITLNIAGKDGAEIARTARMVGDVVAAIPGTADVRLSSTDAQPLVNFTLLRDAASDLGATADMSGDALRAMVNGSEISDLRRPDGTVDPIVIRLPKALRQNPEMLMDLPVARGAGVPVTLREIALREDGVGPTRIERLDRSRVITVTAQLDGRVLGDVMAEVRATLDGIDLPDGVSVGMGGDADLMGDTIVSMTVALIMAVVFVYLVLASQFASFLQPLAIMASLPLALSGVVLGLLTAGSTLNLYSMIGVVTLMGLVVKNAILLVDNANQYRRAGLALQPALLKAGVTRFRPIMMTTLAMIFGMLPLALAVHPGSEQSASMAQAVIGGLVSSTLLTLVVVPVALVWTGRFSDRSQGYPYRTAAR
ncbi:efflux RND transporter permease subunit [Paracoccus aestuariivivens]|uniref:MMPL family transporter n=1 Tax=Paracoccus aestuariivivens TaxID=1820333 RepID=A0A6L6J792_9RHOB|nr:efflux RND transporter permease subunit [Paracoccus aestuariivivens]MTH77045.1 MMPL family transporter [Paracoccus aestuariivivens]